MNKNSVLISVLGLVLGFIIGFWVCNNFFFERNPGPSRATTAPANSANPAAPADPANADPNNPMLSPEEIKQVIARADANPTDLALQKNLGIALYKYASSQQDVKLLPDVRRLLERASQANPKDVDMLIALGNVNFDIGQNSDPESFKKASELYSQALILKPDDVNVRTDLGLTYFFGRPSDPARAIAEYRKSLAIDPRHELTLQNLAFALIATGAFDEADKTMTALESVNPSNQMLPNLRAQLAQKRNAAK